MLVKDTQRNVFAPVCVSDRFSLQVDITEDQDVSYPCVKTNRLQWVCNSIPCVQFGKTLSDFE